MAPRGFRSLSSFPILILFTRQCVTFVMNCVRGGELGVAGYTMFVCGSIADDSPYSQSVLRRIAVGVDPSHISGISMWVRGVCYARQVYVGSSWLR